MDTDTEFTTFSNYLHDTVVEAVNMVRGQLGAANIGHFHFSVETKGRTETGKREVEIVYALSGEWGDPAVKGDSIDNVIEEFVRRKGWDKTHKPLRLA